MITSVARQNMDDALFIEWLKSQAIALEVFCLQSATMPLVDAIQRDRAMEKRVVATGNEHGLTTVDEQWLAEQELQETYDSFLAMTGRV